MENKIYQKVPMRMLDPEERIKNFDEVAIGYNKDEAMTEASRCMNCKNKPCVGGCPVHIDIPAFIKEVKEGNFEEAYQIISLSSSLSMICGRVCPQESQCEKECLRGKIMALDKDENGEQMRIPSQAVSIGRLERFVSDLHFEKEGETTKKIPQKGHKIAVIGSGPSGLACAGELLNNGYQVTIFEALHEVGGVLSYGIPEFRLPKRIVKKQVENLVKMGAKIKTNVVIGKTLTLEDLFEDGYEFIYIATGAGLPKFMNIPGEELNGVFSANEFLTRINLMHANKVNFDTPLFEGKKIMVVGGGNVAMDAARCARRLGGEVNIIYRRSESELPARKEEVEHAKEEGIVFNFLTNPTKINGEGKVSSITCIKMELGEPDASGRRRPVVIPNSEFNLESDVVIMALGTSPNPLIRQSTEFLDVESWGGIITDEDGMTSYNKVYAGGDAVTGAATVISAMGAGKKAAQAIIKRINN